jgi:hypothetical protein
VLCPLLLAGVAALPVTGARANGDPASDVLLVEDVFFPSEPIVCRRVARPLEQVAKSALKAGYPVKIAVIGSPVDLGTEPNYYGRPHAYARFLGGELGTALTGAQRTRAHGGARRKAGKRISYRLLVLMPEGFGLFRGARGEARDLRRVRVDPEASNERLVRTAIKAAVTLARASGHDVKRPTVSARRCPKVEAAAATPPESSSSSFPFATVLAPVGLVGLAALVIVLSRRRPPPSGDQPETPSDV